MTEREQELEGWLSAAGIALTTAGISLRGPTSLDTRIYLAKQFEELADNINRTLRTSGEETGETK